MSGYIYIIQLREFLSQDIYKIGRASDIFIRLRQYPKGTQLLLTKYVNNVVDLETKLIARLCECFRHCTEYGREYFQGDRADMERELMSLSKEYTACITDVVSKPTTSTFIDPSHVVIDFINTYREELSGKSLKSRDVHVQFMQWMQTNQTNLVVTHIQFSKLLKTHYDVIHMTHRFPDGVEKAFVFPNLQVTDNDPDTDVDVDPMPDTTLQIYTPFFKSKLVQFKQSNAKIVTIQSSKLHEDFQTFSNEPISLIRFGKQMTELADTTDWILRSTGKITKYVIDVNKLDKCFTPKQSLHITKFLEYLCLQNQDQQEFSLSAFDFRDKMITYFNEVLTIETTPYTDQRVGRDMTMHIEASQGAIIRLYNWGPRRLAAYRFDNDILKVYLAI